MNVTSEMDCSLYQRLFWGNNSVFETSVSDINEGRLPSNNYDIVFSDL